MNSIGGSAQNSRDSGIIDPFLSCSLGSTRMQQQQQQQQQQQEEADQKQQPQTMEHYEEQHMKNAQQEQMPSAIARSTFVNAKQYRRILKRREARVKMEKYFNKKRREFRDRKEREESNEKNIRNDRITGTSIRKN